MGKRTEHGEGKESLVCRRPASSALQLPPRPTPAHTHPSQAPVLAVGGTHSPAFSRPRTTAPVLVSAVAPEDNQVPVTELGTPAPPCPSLVREDCVGRAGCGPVDRRLEWPSAATVLPDAGEPHPRLAASGGKAAGGAGLQTSPSGDPHPRPSPRSSLPAAPGPRGALCSLRPNLCLTRSPHS